MTRSALDIRPNLEPYSAERYDRNGEPISFYEFDHPGASAIYCSAHDLIRFAQLHLKSLRIDQRAVLTDASINQMQTATTSGGSNDGYGLGWRIVSDNHGYRTVNHDGSMGGVRTRLMLVPDENLAVAVLCNGNDGLPIEIADAILSECLDGYSVPKKPHTDQNASDGHLPFTAHSALQGEWVGRVETYSGTLPVKITIPEFGSVIVQFGDELQTILNYPTFSDNRLRGSTLGDIRTDDAAKRPYTLVFDLNLRWNVLNGSVSAISKPGPRLGNALSHWCELEKDPNR